MTHCSHLKIGRPESRFSVKLLLAAACYSVSSKQSRDSRSVTSPRSLSPPRCSRWSSPPSSSARGAASSGSLSESSSSAELSSWPGPRWYLAHRWHLWMKTSRPLSTRWQRMRSRLSLLWMKTFRSLTSLEFASRFWRQFFQRPSPSWPGKITKELRSNSHSYSGWHIAWPPLCWCSGSASAASGSLWPASWL